MDSLCMPSIKLVPLAGQAHSECGIQWVVGVCGLGVGVIPPGLEPWAELRIARRLTSHTGWPVHNDLVPSVLECMCMV